MENTKFFLLETFGLAPSCIQYMDFDNKPTSGWIIDGWKFGWVDESMDTKFSKAGC